MLTTITFVFGGVHYGTIPIATPYVKGKPLVLYVVPQRDCAGNDFAGPLDCLVTDDVSLAAELDVAR
ncbi:MAG: hypothetical protein M3169_18905 [Candidatus Eremiobacteraeota bacterium]|nr:hypothetical protein [Candidatus Eremiobacteraeota bacterium]